MLLSGYGKFNWRVNKLTFQKAKKNSAQQKDSANIQKAATKDTKIDEPEYREQPYPGEIFNVTNQLPLIQRHEARNKYAGLRVKWRGSIQNLYLDDNNLVTLTVRVDDHDNNLVTLTVRVDDHDTFTYVRCKVKISEYPEVKIAKDGHVIWVYGEIKYIGNTDIELTNCKIKLD